MGCHEYLPYSRKLSREKTFVNFTVLWLFAKVFSTKFGDVATFGAAQVSNPHKFFFHEIVISLIREKFSPSKAFRYTVLHK